MPSRSLRPPARRAGRAALLALLALLVLLPLGGLLFEAYAEGTAARELPAPGELVDIGGRRLHLLCLGDGEPTVLFEASGWGTAISATRARERLAARTTVCSYDRSGNGWSDPGTGRASATDLARDLAVLQDRAPIRWPLVIVASSIGGLTAEMFAREYPERVAGLVLVDAATSGVLSRLIAEVDGARTALCAASVLARFGVVRLIDPFGLDETTAEGRVAAALAYNPRSWTQLCAMVRQLERTRQAFAAAPPLPDDLPVVVLSASSTEGLIPPGAGGEVDAAALHAAAVDAHQQLARATTAGKWQLVPDSTHLIAESQPDTVADAVIDVLEQIR